MPLSIGIVGLPNVGKSTLFNALTRSAAAAAENFPFCTIDPNVGSAELADARLAQLARVAGSARVVPERVRFTDIAGLVRGASRGEGLGNAFLGHIRECEAVAMVCRFFTEGDVTHVEGRVSPRDDLDILMTELLLADAESAKKAHEKAARDAKTGLKEARERAQSWEKIRAHVEGGAAARELPEELREAIDIPLLTAKPMIFVANVSEGDLGKVSAQQVRDELSLVASDEVIVLCARVEGELVELPEDEAAQMLASFGAAESGLAALARAGASALKRRYFFTAGEQEARAWSIPAGASAPQAAGVIHTDFEKKFIRAQVCTCQDFVELGGWTGAREAGKVRSEGKEYEVKSGRCVPVFFGLKRGNFW